MSNSIFSAPPILEPALWAAIGGLTLIFWVALVVAVISGARNKQARRIARDTVDCVPEFPDIRRFASPEEIEALRVRAGLTREKGGPK